MFLGGLLISSRIFLFCPSFSLLYYALVETALNLADIVVRSLSKKTQNPALSIDPPVSSSEFTQTFRVLASIVSFFYLFEKMIRTEDANRSEGYERASWSRSHDLRHHLPPDFSAFASHQAAFAPHQEVMHQEALLAGYRIPQPNMQSFLAAQTSAHTMAVGGASFPPAGGSQHTLIAEFRAFQKAEAARTLKENQTKEASMYEQLGRATAAATAISFQGTFSPAGGGSLHGMEADYRVAQQAEAARTLREKQSRDFLMYAQLEQAKAASAATSFLGAAHSGPFQYQGMLHPPPSWAPLRSPANANMAPSVTPDSSVAGPYSGRANSHTSPPRYHSSHLSGPPRHPQDPARADTVSARERVRYPTTTKVKTQPKKKLCRYYLKSSKLRNYSAHKRSVPNKTESADI